jgi:hypothetical protein
LQQLQITWAGVFTVHIGEARKLIWLVCVASEEGDKGQSLCMTFFSVLGTLTLEFSDMDNATPVE